MSHVLINVTGNRVLNKTIWPPYLYVFNDLLVYKKRSWFIVKEMTITYTQITQVNMYSGILFAKLEIITPTNDEHIITVKYVPKSQAVKAKRIIDQKVHTAHSNSKYEDEKDMKTLEKSITRLNELLHRGKITKQEYNKQKSILLKDI